MIMKSIALLYRPNFKPQKCVNSDCHIVQNSIVRAIFAQLCDEQTTVQIDIIQQANMTGPEALAVKMTVRLYHRTMLFSRYGYKGLRASVNLVVLTCLVKVSDSCEN